MISGIVIKGPTPIMSMMLRAVASRRPTSRASPGTEELLLIRDVRVIGDVAGLLCLECITETDDRSYSPAYRHHPIQQRSIALSVMQDGHNRKGNAYAACKKNTLEVNISRRLFGRGAVLVVAIDE